MKMKPYSFTPAVRLSLFFALAQDQHNFELFGEVRNHIEAAFWNEACERLHDEDKQVMRECLDKARAKLNGKPVRIPNEEHRTFHLTVFKRLDNPFVMGILEAYWDAYNAVELNRYSDYSYLQQVWNLPRADFRRDLQRRLRTRQKPVHRPHQSDPLPTEDAAHPRPDRK